MPVTQLTEREMDTLREVGNIGAGNAATALSQVLGHRVLLEIPQVRAVELREVPETLGGAETVIIGIHMRVLGEIRGNLLVTLSTDSAASLLERMGVPGVDLFALPEMAASALRELGNILVSTYLSSVSQVLQRSLVPSVPGLAIDMAGAVVDFLLSELGAVTDRAMVLETAFQETAGTVRGHFFLLPEPDDLEALIMGMRASG